MAARRYSPKEFLKNRRPERFSDSIGRDTPILDRSQLEYHLDTITSRGEENKFEQFSRRLLEHTVCPNLIPHTGPTGGGDSRVDSETHPVAESLSLGWYVGNGNLAATERWGFAFSAKEKWQPKVKADIAKIVLTGRGYSKAFFVTNQYVSDRKRASLEDELRTAHKIDVRIFDRTWILDKVFQGKLEQLAIDELAIAVTVHTQLRRGPLDTERAHDLEGVENRIAKSLQEQSFGHSLVNDCLLAADLARSLELPRIEVDGRFTRADELAMKFGSPHQQVQSIYDQIWTAFFWHEDFKKALVLYSVLEKRAQGSVNIQDLQLEMNILSVLHGAVANKALDLKEETLPDLRARLTAELTRFSENTDRPTTSLQARELLLQIKLLSSLGNDVGPVLTELSALVVESEPHVGFPVTRLVEILTELGSILGDHPEYEKLFNTIVSVSSRREGELAAARMLLKRGEQELKNERYYDAIRNLGRALGRLYKNESIQDAIHALYLCAGAYEEVGLLWAARGTMLSAASLATSDFWKDEKVTPQQALCYNRIKWLELRLGRIPQILSWHELDRGIREVLKQRGYPMERLANDDQAFDAILGMLLLRAQTDDLRELTRLPNVLDELGLPGASIALLYSLGHDEELPDELVQESSSEEGRIALFRKWRDQPSGKEIAVRPQLYTHRTLQMQSRVLGCQITVDCQNEPHCVAVGESIIAALESFLATGVLTHMAAMEPAITINVRPSDFGESLVRFEMKLIEGVPLFEVRCLQFNPHSMSAEEQSSVKGTLLQIVGTVVAHVFMIGNMEDTLAQLFRDELAPQRAIDFASSFVVLGNVMGHTQKTMVSDWTIDNGKDFALRRIHAWDHGDRKSEIRDTTRPKLANPSEPPPPEMLDPNNVAHSQMETVSLIRARLWDEAQWSGTGFIGLPDNSRPPMMALMFKNSEFAAKIFRHWRTELGAHDVEDKLRISIIRGISQTNPYAYRVAIGLDPTKAGSGPGIKQVVSVTRLNTMEASTDLNLNRFLGGIRPWGGYFLTHALIVDGQMQGWADIAIRKGLPVVRNAWEIGLRDIDSVAIQPDDDPIVPAEETNAPIIELLETRSAKRTRGEKE